MIYITGDIHGNAARLESSFLEAGSLHIHTDDYIIICGDFAIPWGSIRDEEDARQFDILRRLPYTLLFVDGNHENFDRLYAFPEKDWHGGKVHEILPNVLHLERGYIYTVEDKTFFTFGGAASTDKGRRTEGISWWPQELPTAAEKALALQALDDARWAVDYVVTHTAPQAWQYAEFPHAPKSFWGEPCPTAAFLDTIAKRLTYRRWFFGHIHMDQSLPYRKDTWLYTDIVDLAGQSVWTPTLDSLIPFVPSELAQTLISFTTTAYPDERSRWLAANKVYNEIEYAYGTGQISPEFAHILHTYTN